MTTRDRQIRFRDRTIPLAAGLCAALILLSLVLAPSDSRIGGLIRLVYLHGALVWVGLVGFSVAGALGLVALVVRRPLWYHGCQAAGLSAFLLWCAYLVVAVLVTGLAWGQWLAWDEPRVRVSALILVASATTLVASRLVGQDDFTAAVGLAMGIVPWIAVNQAEAIRHPASPIRASGSLPIQFFFALTVGAVALLAGLLVLWLWLGVELGEAAGVS